ncbi:MAG: TolC family protein [Bacteroidales bacterium]
MKIRALSSTLLLLLPLLLSSQRIITLEECQESALNISPAARQKLLVDERVKEELSAKKVGLTPQLQFNAQASYQSDVTRIPIEIPNVEVLSKDQYRASVDFTQVIWDGGINRSQRELLSSKGEVDKQQAVVSIYRLKENIEQIYLSIILVEKQREALRVQMNTLQSRSKMVESMVSNGVSLPSELSKIEVEKLRIEQSIDDCSSSRIALIQSLTRLTAIEIDDSSKFALPNIEYTPMGRIESRRPEIKLYDLHRESIDRSIAVIKGEFMPKLSLFASGGYGLPGFNMLNSNFDWFYIGGVKLTVPITGWIIGGKEKRGLQYDRQIISEQREEYLMNLNAEIDRQYVEVDRFMRLISSSKEILDIRSKIERESFAQLEQGVITTSDYLVEFNNELVARLDLERNSIELIRSVLRLRMLLVD